MNNKARWEQSSWRDTLVLGEKMKCQKGKHSRGDCSSTGWQRPGEQKQGYREHLSG